MEGDINPSANIPPDKPTISSVIADDATNKSENTAPILKVSNATVPKESELVKHNGDSEDTLNQKMEQLESKLHARIQHFFSPCEKEFVINSNFRHLPPPPPPLRGCSGAQPL